MAVRGIHLSGLGRVARPVNHNLSRLWPLVGTTSCARSAQMNTPDGGLGAAPDAGSTTWTDVGGKLVIPNVVLNGLGDFHATVTVPDTLGHYTGTVGSFITLPGIPAYLGNSQLQVAP